MSQENEVLQIESVEITCWGCREGIANLLGHMAEGGCAYEIEGISTPYEEEDLEEADEEIETPSVRSMEDEEEEDE